MRLLIVLALGSVVLLLVISAPSPKAPHQMKYCWDGYELNHHYESTTTPKTKSQDKPNANPHGYQFLYYPCQFDHTPISL